MKKITFAFENTFLWNAILNAIRFLIFLCAAVALVVMVASVFMRYVMHMDFFGYEDVLMLFVIWMYYLGATYATYEETHIKGDMMSHLFKTPKAKKFYNISIYAFAVVCMAFWMKWGFGYVTWNFSTGGTTSALKIPLVASQIAIYVGICGLFFFSVLHLIRYIMMKPEYFIAKEDENVVV